MDRDKQVIGITFFYESGKFFHIRNGINGPVKRLQEFQENKIIPESATNSLIVSHISNHSWIGQFLLDSIYF